MAIPINIFEKNEKEIRKLCVDWLFNHNVIAKKQLEKFGMTDYNFLALVKGEIEITYPIFGDNK